MTVQAVKSLILIFENACGKLHVAQPCERSKNWSSR